MVRILGDENLSDDERIVEICVAMGVNESKARELLAKSRGEAPESDVIVLNEAERDAAVSTTATGVATYTLAVDEEALLGSLAAEPVLQHG